MSQSPRCHLQVIFFCADQTSVSWVSYVTENWLLGKIHVHKARNRLCVCLLSGIYLHEAPDKVRGGVSFPRDQTLSEFGETAVGHNGQRCMDFLQDTHITHTLNTCIFPRGEGAGKWSIQLQSLPLLTLMSPVSLSLYWTPVTQPSSSSKLVTEPSTIVTLGGAITQFRDSTVTCQWRIDDRKRTN